DRQQAFPIAQGRHALGRAAVGIAAGAAPSIPLSIVARGRARSFDGPRRYPSCGSVQGMEPPATYCSPANRRGSIVRMRRVLSRPPFSCLHGLAFSDHYPPVVAPDVGSVRRMPMALIRPPMRTLEKWQAQAERDQVTYSPVG